MTKEQYDDLLMDRKDEFTEYIFDHAPDIDMDAYKSVQAWYGSATPGPKLVKCQYCGAYNTDKISNTSRAASASFFGFGSKKLGKEWNCNKCGSDF